MMIAVANDARNVEIETPAFFLPVPPACSRADPRFSGMIAASRGSRQGNANRPRDGNCYAMQCYATNQKKKKSQELCVLGTVKSTTHLTGVCSDQPEQLPRDQRKQSSRREEHPWDRYRGNLRRPGIKRLNGKHNEREPRQRRSEVKGEEEEFEGDTAWIIKS